MCIRMLKARFGTDERLTVIPYGLDAAPGDQYLYIADTHVLSSMMTEMVERPVVPGTQWQKPVTVPVTTFDALIGVFGLPSFAKIDVEGFEPRVLAGLSHAVSAMSLEYQPSALGGTLACLDRLDGLGSYRYAFSSGESMQLSTEWMAPESIRAQLTELSWGDVYARLDP
jgi:FkbM family methyltransferase